MRYDDWKATEPAGEPPSRLVTDEQPRCQWCGDDATMSRTDGATFSLLCRACDEDMRDRDPDDDEDAAFERERELARFGS